jgi:hypothetical protein
LAAISFSAQSISASFTPVVPLLSQFAAVLLDLSERQFEACQLGFSGRQFGY